MEKALFSQYTAQPYPPPQFRIEPPSMDTLPLEWIAPFLEPASSAWFWITAFPVSLKVPLFRIKDAFTENPALDAPSAGVSAPVHTAPPSRTTSPPRVSAAPLLIFMIVPL